MRGTGWRVGMSGCRKKERKRAWELCRGRRFRPQSASSSGIVQTCLLVWRVVTLLTGYQRYCADLSFGMESCNLTSWVSAVLCRLVFCYGEL